MILPGITGNWASKNAKKVQNLQNNSTAVGSVSPHSHDNSNENSQQIPPIAPPQPDNITGNLTNNQVIQGKGKALWQGEEMANQFATRQMDQPVPPPGDPTGDQYGNMFSPFSQKNIVAAPVPQRPIIEPNLETYKVPQVAIEPTKKIYKKLTKQLMREVPRMQMSEQKMEKPREMPRQVIQRVNMEGPLAQTNNYKYKKGDLIDETDHEESTYRSSNEGIISGKRYNVENVSEIQKDDKGQFMTTLGEGEYFGGPTPTSPRVTNYDQGRNAVRDTLRPQRGRVFISNWKKNK